MSLANIHLQDGLVYRKRIYAGFVIITATWIAVILSILLGCRPLSKNWQIYPDPGSKRVYSLRCQTQHVTD